MRRLLVTKECRGRHHCNSCLYKQLEISVCVSIALPRSGAGGELIRPISSTFVTLVLCWLHFHVLCGTLTSQLHVYLQYALLFQKSSLRSLFPGFVELTGEGIAVQILIADTSPTALRPTYEAALATHGTLLREGVADA